MRTNLTLFAITASVYLALGAGDLGAQSYTLTTVAGSDRLRDGKQATTVPFREIRGTAQDSQGNIYIADAADHRVRRIAPNGAISTVAGTGRAGFSGDEGPATEAQLSFPTAVRLDGRGNLYIADYNNKRIRKVVLATGIITTFAGAGTFGFSGDGGPAINARMDPYDVAVDVDGDVYFTDRLNHRIRKITTSTGIVRTIAGLGVPGYTGDNSTAANAALNTPTGIAVDAQKNVYFADFNNLRVRRISSTGMMSTIAGGGFFDDNVPATALFLFFPISVAVEPNGDVVIASVDRIHRVTMANGLARRLAGTANIGFSGDGGASTTATFGGFAYVSVSPNGDILVSDFFNYRVRRIRNGAVDTIAGVGIRNNVAPLETFLSVPSGMVLDGDGNLIFADRFHNQVRMLTGSEVKAVHGDGYPTEEPTRLSQPIGLARDSQGQIYIADSDNHRIVRYVPGGTASSIAGNNGPGLDDGLLATSSRLDSPHAVAVAGDGTFYIADRGNCRVRRVLNGVINTVAGNGSCLFSGDGGPAKEAGLDPANIILDKAGNLVIADFSNSRIRRVDLATGIITTIAGVGTAGYSGDGGPATNAQISRPIGLAADADGNLFFTEYGNAIVRMIAANGTIRTIAGVGNLQFISSGESGPARSIAFDPVHIVAGPNGTLYVADEFNDRIRKLTPAVPTALRVAAGQNASGEPGTRVSVAIDAIDAGGTPVADVTVTFAVTQGAAELSSISVPTGANGRAQVQVTLGPAVGPVRITASATGLAPVTLNMEVTAPSVSIDEMGVFGAGLSVPAVRAMSPNAILSAFGRNFGVGPVFQKVGPGDLVNGKVPTNFRGICVEIAGEKAPVFGASDTQVNFQATRATSGNVNVVVVVGCGTPNERRTNSITLAAQSASPEFFYFVANQDGRNPVAATDTLTGVGIAPENLFPGSGFGPAVAGRIVTIYGTGFGDTEPSVNPGEFPAAAARVKGQVRVLLNGVPVPEENVLYAGVTPGSPGLFQLNLQLPENLSAGDASVVIEIGGVQSPPGAFLTIRGN